MQQQVSRVREHDTATALPAASPHPRTLPTTASCHPSTLLTARCHPGAILPQQPAVTLAPLPQQPAVTPAPSAMLLPPSQQLTPFLDMRGWGGLKTLWNRPFSHWLLKSPYWRANWRRQTTELENLKGGNGAERWEGTTGAGTIRGAGANQRCRRNQL